MIYTYLDAGWNEYTVKCDADYLDCTNDIKEIVQNNTYLTDLSNFVHPFNTFDKINTTFAASGKVKLKKEPRYSDSQIDTLNKKIDEIYKENYDSSKNVSENIKIFHDYIVNHTKYDQSNTTGLSNVSSSSAYGVLIDGIGICSGYSDAMQLFLEKMNVKNYRISSSTHEWNLVYVEGAWRHLDLTWDDPIMSDGSDALKEDYFLIDTNTLLSKDDGEHNFDSSIYIEAK
jgi:transglutaminase/protease-like cytokinesis protein 3